MDQPGVKRTLADQYHGQARRPVCGPGEPADGSLGSLGYGGVGVRL